MSDSSKGLRPRRSSSRSRSKSSGSSGRRKSSGSSSSKGKSSVTESKNKQRHREHRNSRSTTDNAVAAAGVGLVVTGAVSAGVSLLTPVAAVVVPCLAVLKLIGDILAVYHKAGVLVNVARGQANALVETLDAMEANLQELERELTEHKKTSEAQRNAVVKARDVLEARITDCENVMKGFWSALEPKAATGLGRVVSKAKRLKAQFHDVEADLLPALKHQCNMLTKAAQDLEAAVGRVRSVENLGQHAETHHRLDKLLEHQGSARPQHLPTTVLFDLENLPMDVEFFFDPHCLQHELRQRLNQSVDNGLFILAAIGQGGVGKSAMAAKFCLEAIKDVQRYQLVWWVQAEKPETCVQSLQGLLDFLVELQEERQLPTSIASAERLARVCKHEPGSSEWVNALKRLLTKAEASWLLVFDNYSRLVPVNELIPRGMSSETQRHHVLLTTRDDDVDRPLDVRLWTLEESQRFFAEMVFCFKRSDGVVPSMLLPENKEACDQQVRKVCHRVNGLPLALALIARDLHREWRKKRDYDLKSILNKWDQLAEKRKVTVAEPTGQRKQEQTMDAILLMARDRLSSDDTEVKAADVDAVFASVAYVAADNIPIDVLQCDETVVDWLVERALLIHKDGTYCVHRLTQDAMRRRQGSSMTGIQHVLLLLGKAMQSDDAKLQQRVRVHAAIAMSRAQRASVEIPAEAEDVLQNLSLCAAIDDEDIELLQKIHEDNPTAMAQRDTEGLHAFHHAFNNGRPRVILWLGSQVREFRDLSTIKPTTGCTLEKLDLDVRGISDVDLARLVDLLGALTNLTMFYLRNNQLTSDSLHVLCVLTNLTTLNLSNNQLRSIPEELGALTNLTTLFLSNNQLTSDILHVLGALTNLTTLYLSNNQLTSDSLHVLGALTNLTTLNLSNNQLTSVPMELGAMTNLTALYLRNNQLTGLPKELGAFTKLTTLYLSNNQLTSDIFHVLGALTNLTTIYLSNNQLTSDSLHVLSALTNLMALYLGNNQLTILPEELGALTNLTALYLDTNQLTSDSLHVLGALTNLTTLYLDTNLLTRDDSLHVLGALTNLTTLTIHNNLLTSDDIPAPLLERAKSGALSLLL